MNARQCLYGSMLAAAFIMVVAPQAVLADPASHDVQIYAGEIFGDRLTATPITGRYPILNDNATFGARYTYGLSRSFALQLAAGYSAGRAAQVVTGDSSLGLTTADLDVLFNVTPMLILGGRRFVLYTELGVGYAWTDLQHPLLGSIAGMPVRLDGSNDYTANIGFGAEYYLTEEFFVDLDARYRYMRGLVSRHSQGLNTAQTTLGVGYAF